MAKKLVNGVEMEMDPAEAQEFEASRTPTLGQARRTMFARIDARRSVAEGAGFVFAADSKRYASDAWALSRLTVLASRARAAKAASEAFSVRVQATDDSESAFNADALIALEHGAGDHFKACSDAARTLRQAVRNAIDVAGVLAVDIDSGWPP